MDNKNYTREDVSKTEVHLKVTIPDDAFQKSYETLLKERASGLDIKGFRKGEVPKDIAESKLQVAVLSETFERLAPYYANAAIMEEKLVPIAPPEYKDLADLDQGKPVSFTIVVTQMPEFKLGDLKKIKPKKEKFEAKKEEIQNTLENMYKNNAESKEDAEKVELTDEWATKIAETYKFENVKSLKDLEKEVADVIVSQKQQVADQNAANDVVRQAVEISGVEIPEAAVKFEVSQREEAFLKDVKELNLTAEEFCERQGITYDDLKTRWEVDSKDALENDVILKLYADDRKVETSDDELKAEVERLKASAKMQYEQQHAGHDHESHFDEAAYEDPNWQANIRTYLRKQKAFQEMLREVLGEEYAIKAGAAPKEGKKATKKKAKAKKSTGKKKAAKTEKNNKK